MSWYLACRVGGAFVSEATELLRNKEDHPSDVHSEFQLWPLGEGLWLGLDGCPLC